MFTEEHFVINLAFFTVKFFRHFFKRHLDKIQLDDERRSFSEFTLRFNCSMHKVEKIFYNCKSKATACGLGSKLIMLVRKWMEQSVVYKVFAHAYSRITNRKHVMVHFFITTKRVKRERHYSAFGRELNGI